MPKLSKPLTAAFVRNAKPKPDGKPATYGDGRYGLALKVERGKGGHVLKRWVQKVTLPDGRRTFVGHGNADLVPLAEARLLAVDTAAAARRGEDVRRRKPAEPAALTFEAAWRAMHDKMSAANSSARTAECRSQRYRCYVADAIGSKPVNEVTHDDIVSILAPVWHDKPGVSKNVRLDILRALSGVIGQGLDAMPTSKEALEATLGPRQRREVERRKAVAHTDIPAAVAAIIAADRPAADKLALLFTVLTAGRSIETRRADWQEINFDSGVWTQPGERMKAGRTHRVPLAAPVLTLLATVGHAATGKVFAGLSDCAMRAVVKSAELVDIDGKPADVHGFRTSFAEWAQETGQDEAAAKIAIAHGNGGQSDSDGAYFRSDRLDARRELMAAWASYCLSAVDDHEAMWVDLAAS